MKFYSTNIFLGLLLSAQLLADEAPPKELVVTLHNNEKPITCSSQGLMGGTPTYLCDGERPVLLRNSGNHFDALVIRKDGSNYLTFPHKVYEGDMLLSEYPNSTPPIKAKTINEEYERTAVAAPLFFDPEIYDPKTELFSERFNEIKDLALEKSRDIFKKLQDDLYSDVLRIEFGNGVKTYCRRPKSHTKSPSLAVSSSTPGHDMDVLCGAYKCDDVRIKGKKITPHLLTETTLGTFGPNFTLLIEDSKGQPQVAPDIKKITAEKGRLAWLDPDAGLAKVATESGPEISIPKKIEKMVAFPLIGNALRKDLLRTNKNICTEPNPTIKFLKNIQRNVQEEVAKVEVVELIGVIDDILYSQYVLPGVAKEIGCFYNGVYLLPDLAPHLDKINKNLSTYADPRAITEEEANDLFKYATGMKDIAFGYKQDGCYARAHLMARRFEERGVYVDKAWIKGDLYVPEPNSKIEWNYHVSPLLYVQDENGDVKKMVIDPSLFDRPVTLEEWDKKMAKYTAKGSVMTEFPFPSNAAKLERSALAISRSDNYTPADKITTTEDEKMKSAINVMKRYKELE